MNDKLKYKVDISLDVLEAILGLSQENFAIASIEVDESGQNPSLTLGIAKNPILNVSKLESVEIPQLTYHDYGNGFITPCWGSVELIGDILKDE